MAHSVEKRVQTKMVGKSRNTIQRERYLILKILPRGVRRRVGFVWRQPQGSDLGQLPTVVWGLECGGLQKS